MIIRGRRVRNLNRHLRGVPADAPVVVALGEPERMLDTLQALGFTARLEPGERILPPDRGPRSRYNAEGEYEKHKDRPMETAYRQVEWHWREFRGPYDTVERSDIRDVSYKRYQRTFHPPPSVELTVAIRPDGQKFIVTDRIPRANADLLLHCVNLFLELFGEAEVLAENLDRFIVSELRRLNWRLLPEGRTPWPQMHGHLRPLIERLPGGNQPVVKHRLETINSFEPTFTAIGEGGFSGYIVFGFPERTLFVLESIHYGNATYVFGRDWEDLWRRTKAEILGGNLEKDRIIHRAGWDNRVRALLG